MINDSIRQKRLSDDEKLQCVREGYDRFAEEWDRTRQGNWKEFQLVDEMMFQGAKVLDLGCGNGRLYGYINGSASRRSATCHTEEHCDSNASRSVCGRSPQHDIVYTGIDNSSKLIEIAKSNFPEGNFLIGDALHLPFKDDSFDIVLSFAVLHHIPPAHHIQFIKEIDRVLKPEGRALVTVWNMFQDRYRHYTCPHVWNCWMPKREVIIPFGEEKIPRYVYAFTPRSLSKLFRRRFIIQRFLKTRGERSVCSVRTARNFVVKVRRRWE